MYLLDTNVLSELIRKRPNPGVVARVELLDRQDCFASEITLFELRYGAVLRSDAEAFWRHLCQEVLPTVTWVPLDAAIHLRAADLAAELERTGRVIGNEDCWIAATALEHGLTVSSRNESHFERIPGLRIENWFST